MGELLPGRATQATTTSYAARSARAPGHFRDLGGLALSSIGVGTYLGGADDSTDAQYRQALTRAVEVGFNLFDTAINYRHQRSERALGQALGEAIARGAVRREELVVATKGGFLAFDGGVPADPRDYVERTYVRPGVLAWDELAPIGHAMTPRFLEDQLERSRVNLGLQTLDLYYLHNPEAELELMPRAQFRARLRAVFELFERASADGRIGLYGVATWEGLRAVPGAAGHLSLEELVGLAREVAGDEHHLRVVQLPYNLGMLEAFDAPNQERGLRQVTLLEAAAELGVYVTCSATLLQGRLARGLPPAVGAALGGLATDAQRAIQFVRSTPGVGSALVGMKQAAHIEEAAAVSIRSPASEASIRSLID